MTQPRTREINPDYLDAWLTVKTIADAEEYKYQQTAVLPTIDLTNMNDPRTKKFLQHSMELEASIIMRCEYLYLQQAVAEQAQQKEKEAVVKEWRDQMERDAEAFVKELNESYQKTAEDKPPTEAAASYMELLNEKEKEIEQRIEGLREERVELKQRHEELKTAADVVLKEEASKWEERHTEAIERVFSDDYKGFDGKSYSEVEQEFKAKMEDPKFAAAVESCEQQKQDVESDQQRLSDLSQKIQDATNRLHIAEDKFGQSDDPNQKHPEIKKIEDEIANLKKERDDLLVKMKQAPEISSEHDKAKHVAVNAQGQEISKEALINAFNTHKPNPSVLAAHDVNEGLMRVIDRAMESPSIAAAAAAPPSAQSDAAATAPPPPPPPIPAARIKETIAAAVVGKGEMHAELLRSADFAGKVDMPTEGVDASPMLKPSDILKMYKSGNVLAAITAQVNGKTHDKDVTAMTSIVDASHKAHEAAKSVLAKDLEIEQEEVKLGAVQAEKRSLSASMEPEPEPAPAQPEDRSSRMGMGR